MRTRRDSRRGISTIIGAVFFVLIVFLVFSSTIIVFQAFTSYAGTFRQVNQQDIQNKASVVALSSFVFGGVTTPSPPSATLNAIANPNKPLLPVANMNLTNNMQGWTFSRSYQVVRDDASVINSFLSVLPGATQFTMGVNNSDPASVVSHIVKIVLNVNPNFGVPVLQATPLDLDYPAPVVSGQSITWVATGPGLAHLQAANFTWTAILPATANTFFSTVTIVWNTIFRGVPISDTGTVAIQTNVVTGGPGKLDQPDGVSDVAPAYCDKTAPLPGVIWPWRNDICAQRPGSIPGGASGGYDGVSSKIGSQSGPGSLYVEFQPTINGTAIRSGQEATGIMNMSTLFYLSASTIADIPVGKCCGLSYGFSLDQILGPPNPLVQTSVYLAQLNPLNQITAIILLNSTVPSNLNSLSPTGWNAFRISFDPTALPEVCYSLGAPIVCPGPWTWTLGTYELIISDSVSIPGVDPPNANYPPSMQMHFDDVGLSLQQTSGSYYDNAANPIEVCATLPAFSGTTTIGTTSTILQDSSAAWVVGQWVGDYLEYTSGPAAPQCLRISANTGNSITTSAFAPAPSGAGDSFTIRSSVDPTQVQSLQLSVQLSQVTATNNVTAYVFIGDVSHDIVQPAQPVWFEVGQVTFISSATIQGNLHSSSSAQFIDNRAPPPGPQQCFNLCIRIYAVSPNGPPFVLNAAVSLVIQSWQLNSAVVTISNNSTTPLQLLDVHLASADGTSNFNLCGGGTLGCNPVGLTQTLCGTMPLAPAAPQGCWVNSGQLLQIQVPASFVWSTGQDYVVSVTTSKGIILSQSYRSP